MVVFKLCQLPTPISRHSPKKELCLIYLVTYNQSIYYGLLCHSMSYSPLLFLFILKLKLPQPDQ